MTEPTDLLDSIRERVDQRLYALLPDASRPPEGLHQAMRYSCLAPGKRIRPALTMAAAQAVGAAGDSVLDAGCAVEMVHAFSLIHDDLPAIDNDELRRGRPTCHVKFGEALAILAGDALFALAFQVLADSPHEPDAKLECLGWLAKASGSDGLVGGEVMDVLSEGKPADADLVETIHRQKTGALIEAACAIGGRLSGADSNQVAALRAYGRQVGLAFQIADDLLNELASAEALGKATGSDRDRMKATYPAVHGLESTRDLAVLAVESGVSALDGLGAPAEPLRDLARYSIERLR